ncbi:MAG: hypothetical protein KME22_13520 [Hassallia sp. WJT32-NPBG1]|nr:hypothetical protein [Hassallia sp. WJT32-NPBG1]
MEELEGNPIKRWMEIAVPILESDEKPVDVIMVLGFISIPLMFGGSSLVPLILAIGASVTAIYSSI